MLAKLEETLCRVRENLCFLMEIIMKDSLLIVIFMVLANIVAKR